MSKLDFNVSPYFDDYDSSKNFLKVLYRPGRPVQARELNQMQSIFQNQIQSFGNHIFKNGSKVSNARTALQAKAYVRLLNTPNVAQYPENTKLVGETSGIEASLVLGVNVEGDDPATLYVVYRTTAIDGETSRFLPGENIRLKDENDVDMAVVTVRCPSCPGSGLDDTIAPLGRGQFFTVDEGIFYFEGMFLEVPKQDIIVSKYLETNEDGHVVDFVPCKIGLDFFQSIITHLDDNTLLDPSLGYPNTTAPGADRYKIDLILVKRPYDAEDGENFIMLARLGEGMKIEMMKSDSEYSEIMDMIAKRTYETNGDYTIRPFRVSFVNSKKESATDAKGWSIDGDEDQLVAVVASSVAYVKGYRVETISDQAVAFPKARSTKQLSSYIKNFDERTYLLGIPAGNSIWPNDTTATGLITQETVLIYDGVATGSSVAGSNIGSFKVSDVAYISGDIPGHAATFKYYIYDLQLNTGKTMANAVSYVLPGNGFYTNAVEDAVSGNVEVYNTNRTGLIFNIDRSDVKSLRSIENPLNGSMSVSVRRKLSGVADAGGVVNFSTSTNEYFDASSSSFMGWRVSGGTTTPFNATSVSSVSPTSMTVTLGAPAAGNTVYILVDILKVNQTEKTKTPTNFTYSTNIQPSATIGAEILLGKADVYRLKSVKVFVDGAPGVEIADVTDEYVLIPNIDDFAYRESMIKRIKTSSVSFNSSHRLAINFDYFSHSGSQGYFTVDSYAPALSASDSGVTYETLGSYKSANNQVFPIASSIDFRPIVMTAPYVASLPANGSTAIFDIEYYLGRADILQINSKGELLVKTGEPSESPRIPRTDDNAMKLYEIWLKPYTYSMNDVTTRYIDNRRFTMRDIGSIEKRLSNVEYFTALNVLEKSAADMSIKDENGLDRFKNGFIADNFSDFQAADLAHVEFHAATDRGQRNLRPSFKASNRKLRLSVSLSEGIYQMGNIVTRPYEEQLTIEQPFATKHLSVNPYLQYNQKGEMALSPNNDVWTDEKEMPDLVIDIDSGAENLQEIAEAAGLLGTDWGSWIDQNRTILTTTSTRQEGSTTTATTVTNQTTSQTRAGTVTTVDSRTDTYSIDDIVKDVQLIPYVRSIAVDFYATKLKANTKVYAFFDAQPVSEFCRDIGFQLSADNASTSTQLVEYGSPLITDENGEIRGEFLIPAGRFFVGEKRFILSDDINLSGDPDVETTRAEALYFAGGLDVTKQDVTLNVITPTFNTKQVSETRSSTTEIGRTTTSTTTAPLPPPAPQQSCQEKYNTWVDAKMNSSFYPGLSCICSVDPNWTSCWDPVAQSFVMEADSFITSLDVYFKQVDIVSDRLFVQLRTMVNGYPGPTVLAEKLYTPDQIQPFCSDDSTTAFNVKFDTPVYVEGNNQYCFVVGGYSPNTRIWVSRLGGEVVNIPGKIVEQPVLTEVSFRSLNNSTWNAEQFEQIKFRLNTAKFETGEMKIVMVNDHLNETFALEENPFQTQVGETRVRVFHKNHGLTENDRVSFSVLDNEPFLIQMADFVPQVGQTLATSTGAGLIRKIVAHSVANQYYVYLSNVSGMFTAAQSYTCDAVTKTVRDNYLVASMNSFKPMSYTLNQCSGTVLENAHGTKYPTGTIAGIPISELNTEHVAGSLGMSVVDVDSIDTYIINVQTPATLTGRYGGLGIIAYNGNEKYEVFNVTGAYLPYRCSETWSLTGVAHGDSNSAFEALNYQIQNPVSFTPQQDTFLAIPYKIASSVNEQILLGSNKSVEVTGTFNCQNTAVAPFINLDTFAITTVSNRVEWQNKTKLEDEPVGAAIWVPEEDMVNGSEKFKYITRTVNLQNPANNLYIFLEVYKDLNADFDIYVKKVSQHDTVSIEQKPWMRATIEKTRSSVDMTDFIEYQIIASEDIVPYVSETVNYPGWGDDGEDPFITFRVKIVGRTRNSAKPPLLRAFRAIAVT